jgi:hypothetical protein
MDIYTTTEPVTLTSGILKLDADQARRRSKYLNKLEDGRFEIVQSVNFKSGETFGFDGDVPKAISKSLIDPDDAVKKSKIKAKKDKKEDPIDQQVDDKEKAE